MDTSRISFGEMVAAASGLALFIFLFLPWFGVSVETGLPGGGEISESASAWEALSFIDIVLFLVAVLAVAMAAARAAGAMPPNLPAPAGQIVAAAGALAVVLILYRLLDTPGPENLPDEVDISRKIGAFLGLIAAGGITFGGWTAAKERASGAAPADRGTPPSQPPPTAPPPTA